MLTLRREAATPADRAEVDRRIVARFGARRAILVSDMSGFSRITRRRGIIHFLALIQHMQDLCAPVIEDAGGAVIKATADNMFALLPDPLCAVRAAQALHVACAEDGRARTPDDRVQLAIGIGYGDILDIDQIDCFGDEVNLAFKLGEDIATTGETLITAAAAAALPGDLPSGSPWSLQRRSRHISGVELGHFEVVFPPR